MATVMKNATKLTTLQITTTEIEGLTTQFELYQQLCNGNTFFLDASGYDATDLEALANILSVPAESLDDTVLFLEVV